MKPIIPKAFNARAMLQVLEVEARDITEQMQGSHEAIVATWEKKPKFIAEVKVTRERITMLVFTTDEVYGWVSGGTRPHIIRAKNAVALRFQSGYKAKTRKGLIGSTAGGPSGPLVSAQAVEHPGTEAREFEKSIAKIYKRVMRKRFADAMKRAAFASGHAMK